MNAFVNTCIKQLGAINQILSAETILSEHPWAFVNNSIKTTTLTFLKKGELLVQDSEGYSIGHWSFYGRFRLIIDADGNEAFYGIEFVNEDLFILQFQFVRRGIDPQFQPDDFMYLLNEATIDDKDIIGYLEKLRKQALNLTSIELVDNRILEIQRGKDYLIKNNCPCFIDKTEANDGRYIAKNKHNYYIAYGVLVKETMIVTFYESDGSPIYVELKAGERWCSIGDKVYVPGVDLPDVQPANNLIYSLGKSTFFVVKEGKIIMHSEEPLDI